MITWKDNMTYVLANEEAKCFWALANRPIASIENDLKNNLLVFPSSFQECKDKIGEQHLFDIYPENQKFSSLKTSNLVGFIGINGLHISIHSRFSKNTEKDFFLHYLLQKVLSINLFNLKHKTTDECIFDFLLHLFPHYLNKALSQGIYKEYQRNTYNDCHVRGAIDIHQHLKRNIPFNGRVAYRTHEFSQDNSMTQLIRHTIEYIRTQENGERLLHDNPDTQANVSRVIFATPEYQRQDRKKIIQNNAKLVCHPYFTQYPALQNICLRILKQEELKYGRNDDEILGILFDISWLWEEYLATILMQYGFKHPNNRRMKGGIYLGYDSGNRCKASLVRYPDFYNKESHGVIIDAKYKKSIDEKEDVNQMITYMYRLKGHLGIFIQPSIEPNGKEVNLQGYGIDAQARLMIYPFLIPTQVSDYKDFKKAMEEEEDSLKTMLINQCAYG